MWVHHALPLAKMLLFHRVSNHKMTMLSCCLGALRFPRTIDPAHLPGPFQLSFVRERVQLPPESPGATGSITVSVFYPALDGHGQTNEPYWRQSAIEGMSQYAGVSLYVFRHLNWKRHPAGPPRKALLPSNDPGGWPVVIFSHGLGGNRNLDFVVAHVCFMNRLPRSITMTCPSAGNADMYVQPCRCLASYGYIVIHLEHADGMRE
jgi:predicted dienelactone hydrolase